MEPPVGPAFPEVPVPGPFDLAYVALFTLGFLAWEHFVAWPRLQRDLLVDAPRARRRAYRNVLLLQWPLAAVVAARWVAGALPWSRLGVVMPRGAVLIAAIVANVALAAMFIVQTRRLARVSPERRAAVAARFGRVADLLPHTRAEHRWFQAVAVTAGVCEETLYRGFAVWALAPWLTVGGAAATSVVLFGLAHSYQGRAGAVRSTAVGAVLAVLALATGSILPGILLHAIIDLGGGATGYVLLRDGAVDA